MTTWTGINVAILIDDKIAADKTLADAAAQKLIDDKIAADKALADAAAQKLIDDKIAADKALADAAAQKLIDDKLAADKALADAAAQTKPVIPAAPNKFTPILNELVKGTPEEIDKIEDEIEDGIKAGTTTVLTMSAIQSTKRSDDTPTLPAIEVTKESKSKNDEKNDGKNKKDSLSKDVVLVATSTDSKTTPPPRQCK